MFLDKILQIMQYITNLDRLTAIINNMMSLGVSLILLLTQELEFAGAIK